MLDLIIIGGSAAASSAAIYSARRKLNFKMITKDLGGEVAMSGEVGNWPGIINIQGFELAKQFTEHVKFYDVDIEEGYSVKKIEAKDNYYIVHAKNFSEEEKIYETKTIIVATGIHPRHLEIPNEEKLFHKGVTYCTVCDGPLMRDKTTVTIGSGNSALESALMMSQIAKKVYLISKYSNTKENNGGFPRGENILIDKVKAKDNVEIIYSAQTIKILGEERVKGLKYITDAGEEKELLADGVMIHIGFTPNSHFIDCVEKDRAGQIIIDQKGATNCAGIFAAGDVTDIPYKQIGIASGQGIIAALSAIEYVNKWK